MKDREFFTMALAKLRGRQVHADEQGRLAVYVPLRYSVVPPADAADGADVAGRPRVVTQLAPQVADVDVDEMFVAGDASGVRPDGIQELLHALILKGRTTKNWKSF